MDDVLSGNADKGMKAPSQPDPGMWTSEDFKIVQMTMKDAYDKGRVLWQVKDWSLGEDE